MRKHSGISSRHEQFSLTYGVLDENERPHELICLVMARAANSTKVLAGFAKDVSFYLEFRYMDPETEEVVRELNHRFTQETYQGLITAINNDAESYTVQCKEERFDSEELTDAELIIPLKDSRRFDNFVLRFIALSRAVSSGELDTSYPYDDVPTQHAADA